MELDGRYGKGEAEATWPIQWGSRRYGIVQISPVS